MNRFALFIFLAVLVFVDAQNITACNGTIEINYSNETYWYPYKFSTDQYNPKIPKFPMGFNCEYQINVPADYFAQISLTVVTARDKGQAPVQISDNVSGTEGLFSVTEMLVFFISPGGSIKLATGTENLQFGFFVNWKPYITDTPIRRSLSPSDRQPVVIETPGNSSAIVVSDDKIIAYIYPLNEYISPPLSKYERVYRGTFIFDGPTTNSPCIGTAWPFLRNGTMIKSSGKYLTIQFFYLESSSNPYISIQIVAQDYESNKDITRFQTFSCDLYGTCGTIQLDASNGPVALQTYSPVNFPWRTSKSVDIIVSLNTSDTLEVYGGGICESNLIASYSPDYDPTTLPQNFWGTFKTYVLRKGRASLNYTNRAGGRFSITTVPRKGFITSYNYGFKTNDQAMEAVLSNTDYNITRKFSFQVRDMDLVDTAYLRVHGYGWEWDDSQGMMVFTRVYAKTYGLQYPPTPGQVDVFEGAILEVIFYTLNQSTAYDNKGFYANFTVEDVKQGTAPIGILSVLLFIALWLF
ncbi:unnamed protein product [Caenorhabditis brenneri]